MAKLDQALDALDKKYATCFAIETNPDNQEEVQLVSVNRRLFTVYTNFVSHQALSNYIAERLARR